MTRSVRAIDGEKCGLYRPGHQVHWTQARRARAGRRVKGHVTGIDEQGWITVETVNGTETFWHHDRERAREVVEAAGGEIEVGENGVLLAPAGTSTYFLCVSRTEATPCVSLAQLVEARFAQAASAQDLELLN